MSFWMSGGARILIRPRRAVRDEFRNLSIGCFFRYCPSTLSIQSIGNDGRSKVHLVGSLESWHKKTFNCHLIETSQKLNSPAACVARLQKMLISLSFSIPPRTMLTADQPHRLRLDAG